MNMRAEKIREVARSLEHGAEFDANEAMRFSKAQQADNNRLITQSRELYALADRIERDDEATDDSQHESDILDAETRHYASEGYWQGE